MGFFSFNRIKEVIRYRNGSTFTTLLNGSSSYSTITEDEKLRLMLTNPALAKVVFLNCDVFSLLEIKRKDGNQDDLTKKLKNPNYFQTQRQFLWSYRFWLMFGNSYLKTSNNRLESELQQLYWLEPNKLQWTDNLTKKLDKMILSKASLKAIERSKIAYKYADNTSINIELKDLIAFHDLTNGLGNWYKGNSRIDAIWKILNNSEAGLDAKNINLEFSRKFLVSGNYDPSKDYHSTAGMQDIEKEDIKAKLRGNEPIHPLKTNANIHRFVDDLAKLKLDESYNEDLHKVGSLFNIPADVLEALKQGSTYENQEKSIGRHINYSEMPKAIDLLEGLCTYFGLNIEDYEATFNNNSFMQVFEKDKSIVNMTNARTLETLVKNGADANEVAEMLGINLTFKKNEQV